MRLENQRIQESEQYRRRNARCGSYYSTSKRAEYSLSLNRLHGSHGQRIAESKKRHCRACTRKIHQRLVYAQGSQQHAAYHKQHQYSRSAQLGNHEKRLTYAADQPGWSIAPSNYEGVRVNLDKAHGDGWFLLRLSLHDPLMPLNIESDCVGGVKVIAKQLYAFLQQYDKLDTSAMAAFV